MKFIQINAFDIQDEFVDTCGCVGYFDGIHIGHQQLINTCLKVSKDKNIASSFITFNPDPWTVFHKGQVYHHLTTLEDKIKIVESYGIDYFYCIDFTKEFAGLSIEEFHKVLKKIGIKDLVCGFDFRYGTRNCGDIETLKQCDFMDVHIVDSVNQKNLKISTSRIEPLIQDGDLLEANHLLGYSYSIKGIVVYGFRRGTTLLNIPTANLKTDEEYLIPAVGVYSGWVKVKDQFYMAMINIGNNPTFNNENNTIEAHLLDFSQDIYGEEIRIYFYNKIRNEIKFDGFEKLKEQLFHDIDTTRIELTNEIDLFDKTKIIWNK